MIELENFLLGRRVRVVCGAGEKTKTVDKNKRAWDLVGGQIFQVKKDPRPGEITAEAIVLTSLDNRRPGVIRLMTADCVPIVMTVGTTVAVVHGGWLSLVRGVIHKTLKVILEKSNGGIVKIWLGPHICSACYPQRFLIGKIKIFLSRVFGYKKAIKNLHNCPCLDLVEMIRIDLSKVLKTEQFVFMGSKICTFEDPKLPSRRGGRSADNSRIITLVFMS